jgi:hypothetical protein
MRSRFTFTKVQKTIETPYTLLRRVRYLTKAQKTIEPPYTSFRRVRYLMNFLKKSFTTLLKNRTIRSKVLFPKGIKGPNRNRMKLSFDNSNRIFFEGLEAELIIVKDLSSTLSSIQLLYERDRKRYAPDVNRYIRDSKLEYIAWMAKFNIRSFHFSLSDPCHFQEDENSCALKPSAFYLIPYIGVISCLLVEYNGILKNLNQYGGRKKKNRS